MHIMKVDVYRADWRSSAAMRDLAAGLREDVGQLDPPREPVETFRYLHEVDAWLLDPNYLVLLAVADGSPAGFFALQLNSAFGSWGKHPLHIRGFYVRPEYERTHVSSMLYRWALRIAAKEGADIAQVMVRSNHASILKLAEDHGFRQVGVILERSLQCQATAKPLGRSSPRSSPSPGCNSSNQPSATC